MTVSQPSKLVYVIALPQVKNLTATFTYNFFTPDECTNGSGGVPATALSRPASTINADFIQWSLTRVPREVDFSFSLPKLADVGNTVSALAQRNNSNGTTGAQYGSLIKDNIDKVVNEDFFALNSFVAVSFGDGEIGDKVHDLVSGTLATYMLQREGPTSTSPYKAAQLLATALPDSINANFVTQALTQPANSYGGQFYPASSTSPTATPTQNPKSLPASYANGFFERLKGVRTNTQINAKLLHDLINGTIRDPTSTTAADVVNLHSYAKQVKQATNQRFSTALAASDYKTFVPYVSVRKQSTALHHTKYSAEIVGFIIDKFEIMPDGTTVPSDPIIIDSPTSALTADFQVKFHANYCYTIRTIGQLTLPAIDSATGDVATIRILVSSKPSNKVYVNTTKLVAPPPPGDVDFMLDYETNRLLVTWAFPVWSQQDIKQFQVFRRSNTDEPFQLLKVYNFDDSAVKFPDNENPDPRVIEYLTSPCQFFFDDDFNVASNTTSAKGYIYSVSCIDAHGLSSTLSAQYRVWYDPFKNQLQKQHVSHLGAPKPYPNLYLDGDVFVNTIKVNGSNNKTVRLYFNPEYYYLIDDQGRTSPVVATQQRGGSYKLQFINLDNGKAQDVDVAINDQTTLNPNVLSTPQVNLGPQAINTAVQNSSG